MGEPITIDPLATPRLMIVLYRKTFLDTEEVLLDLRLLDRLVVIAEPLLLKELRLFLDDS
jgi:hypothetical protein